MKYDSLSEDELRTYLSKFHNKYIAPTPKTKEEREKTGELIKQKLASVEKLFCIIETSVNEKEFALALRKLTITLYDLTSYENVFDFPELPSKTMQMVWENRVQYMDRLYERIKEQDEKNLDGMDGYQFEKFCAELLIKNCFINVEVTSGSGDHGIDVLAEKDSISYAIQCKCYSSNIGNAAVQQAHTGKSIYRRDIAAVLTNRYFTAQAKEEAGVLGVKLWDRDKLISMMENA